jgi:hypothetical protein
MSDSVSNLEQIETAQAQKEVTANQLFDAVSPMAIFGRHAEACSGLTWGYYGGRWGGEEVDNGTLALVSSSTNQIVADRLTGDVMLDDSGEWDDTANYGRLYLVTTSVTGVSSYEDHRAGQFGIWNGGAVGGGFPDGDKGDIVVSGSATVMTIDDNVVTYAKMQNVSATQRALGRNTSGAGDPEEVTLTQLLDWIGSAAQGDILYRGSSSWTRLAAGTAGQVLRTAGAAANPAWDYPHEVIIVAASDEASVIGAGTGKVTFRMPYAFTLSAVRASLTTAQASGSIFTVDINEAGSTVLSTKLTIDNTEKTSTTAATAAVISDASLADDAEITVDVDQIGDGTAMGLKVYLIGKRT